MAARTKASPQNELAELVRSVDSALAGLDRAEQFRDDGKYSEAMERYEENIGALIGHLKSIKKNDNSGIDRSVLADRVRVALSDAEAIKRFLAAGGESTARTIAATTTTTTGGNVELRRPADLPISRTARMSSAFSMLSGIGKSRSHDRFDAANNAETQKLRKHYDYAHALAMRNNPTKKQSSAPDLSPAATVTVNPPPINQTYSDLSNPSTAASTQKSRRPSPGRRRKRSNLNYASNDPLIRAVKSELYVDKSRLTTRWDDVVGLVAAKRALREAAILPVVRPDLYTGLRSAPKGILLYGPPGTGKTMLVRAAAKESKCILFSCSASSLTSKWHGEGEKLLRSLFAVAADAAPSMIFFDEVDALLSSRRGGGDEHEASRRFKTEFMVQMDGIVSGNDDGDAGRRVLVLGCTNCPWDVDDAVMRRMSRRIYVELPDRDARRHLLNQLLAKEAGRHSLTKKQIESIVGRTEGYSCSDISSIAQEAAFGPLRDLGGLEEVESCDPEKVRWINKGDFEEALANTKRSVSDDLMERYKVWENRQGVR